MSSSSPFLSEALQGYLQRITVQDSDVQRRLRAETAELEFGHMQICPEQGQFMRWLVGLIGARRALEVGVFTGYSALCVALALPEEGELVACDVSETWTAIARRYWREAGVDGRIRLHLAPAAETLARLRREGGEGSFDIAFVDADKTSYQVYFEHCLALLRPGGVLMFDNVLWSGEVANPESQTPETLAIRALNERLRDDRRVELSLLPVGDGLALARKLA